MASLSLSFSQTQPSSSSPSHHQAETQISQTQALWFFLFLILMVDRSLDQAETQSHSSRNPRLIGAKVDQTHSSRSRYQRRGRHVLRLPDCQLWSTQGLGHWFTDLPQQQSQQQRHLFLDWTVWFRPLRWRWSLRKATLSGNGGGWTKGLRDPPERERWE